MASTPRVVSSETSLKTHRAPSIVSRLRLWSPSPAAISEADLDGRLDGDEVEYGDDSGEAEAARRAEEATKIAESDYALYESLNLLKGLIIVGQRGT